MPGLDISVQTESFSGNEDRSWLGSQVDKQWAPRSITIDVKNGGFLADHLKGGAIPSGLALAKITASGKYGVYDDAAMDGRQTCAGLLFNTTKVGLRGVQTPDLTTAPDVGAPLFWAGVVRTSKLPVPTGGVTTGTLDAAGKADLANFVRFE